LASARAEDYAPAGLSAADVLERAQDARGRLAPGKYVSVERGMLGGLASTTTTHYDGDDWVAVEVRGPFTTSEGSYQGQRWAQDENGIVRLLSSFHESVDPNPGAWRGSDGPVRLLGLTKTASPEYVLEVHPNGGSDQYRYYDAKTFLLDRVVTFSKDRHRHVDVYSDYRNVFGSMVPFQMAFSDGLAQNDERYAVVSFDPSTGSTPMDIPPSRALFNVATGSVEVPSAFADEGVLVRAEINGRGYDFILDTGDSGLTLDPGVAHELGLPAYGRRTITVGGDVDLSQTIVPNFSLGGVEMHDVKFFLSPIDQYVGDLKIVGLLGYDLFASGTVGIDFKKKTVILYSRDAFLAATEHLHPVATALDDAVPRIPVTSEHVDGSFALDTGAFATLAYRHYLAKLPNVHDSHVDIGSFGAVGGEVPAKVCQISDLSFGTLRFGPSDVVVPQTSTFDMGDYDGLIGRNFLSNFAVYFDYADRFIYIDPHPG